MDPLWLSAPRGLLPEIPMVIVGRGGPYQPCAPMLAVQFLKQFLGERQDPALALSQLASPLAIPESVARSAFVSYTAYDSFEVRPLLLQRKNPRSHLRLDRTLARAAVIEQISRLVRSKSRRVESLIAHADAGNLLSHFAEQAVDHIERNGLAPVKRVQLDFPMERSDLHRSLEQALLLWLSFGRRQQSARQRRATSPSGQTCRRVCRVRARSCRPHVVSSRHRGNRPRKHSAPRSRFDQCVGFWQHRGGPARPAFRTGCERESCGSIRSRRTECADTGQPARTSW